MTTRPPRELAVSKLRPAYEQVADQLRQLILSGELRPGEQLPVEGRLCEIFGVSRSTVREAVRLLSAQDLVHTTRGVQGGTFVSSVDPETVASYLTVRLSLLSSADAISVDEMLEARELVEVPAARYAAERATPAEAAALREAADGEARARSNPHSFAQHKEFHELLVDASHNRLLSLMNTPNFQVLQQSHVARAEMPPAFWEAVDEDHRLIAVHVAAGDADAAASATQKHLQRLRDLYVVTDDEPTT
ncbi:GntR family transcriptional regulator [Microbacterium sp. ET2]|uniref:FadR/GntR family transcriptional regulator n=1 Tax=Microbacterium albipurpureum TaxID=3050384 RepID=UPI00259D147A|nr:GntR family transcriptional regulator [Microbacterium sp. ET2 (Ac-2212)]WJL96772.1 GntR family transcriptional regulator [Microbacterium sp. ET2 (Ac-2212)]